MMDRTTCCGGNAHDVQRCQGVCHDLIDLGVEVATPDQGAIAIKWALAREVCSAVRVHDSDVVVTGGVVELLRIDPSDLRAHVLSVADAAETQPDPPIWAERRRPWL